MQSSIALVIPGPMSSILIAAAVFAACVVGAVVFLSWLDKQMPDIPEGSNCNSFLDLSEVQMSLLTSIKIDI